MRIQSGDHLQLLGIHIDVHRREDRLLISLTMEGYLAKLYEDFCAESGKRALRSYNTPEWPENYDFGPLEEQPGLWKSLSRRYVGRILYVVRAVRLESFHACIVVASEVEHWTRGSDVRLERMISYLYVTKARGPVWEFFFSDGSSVDDL